MGPAPKKVVKSTNLATPHQSRNLYGISISITWRTLGNTRLPLAGSKKPVHKLLLLNLMKIKSAKIADAGGEGGEGEEEEGEEF